MAYALAVLAALLLIPALGLGLLTAALVLGAGLLVFVCALALGATGTLLDWILALTAVGMTWRALELGRRAVRRLREALATAGPGIGRLRSG
ncbi:MAG: hypothetical protein N2320_01040 [Candidatus Bipolaricaulota bacterium]|nr:hypothetical protein [Candidatus Bipolaricaulota bacterium]